MQEVEVLTARAPALDNRDKRREMKKNGFPPASRGYHRSSLFIGG